MWGGGTVNWEIHNNIAVTHSELIFQHDMQVVNSSPIVLGIEEIN
jgi:hypothetical protein